MNDQTELRKHLLELLEGKSAHIAIDAALRGFPINLINERCENSPHTAWDLLEHIRIAQNDILEFSRNGRHVSPEFPDGYWSKAVGGTIDWQTSTNQILADLQAMRDLVADETTDLFAPIPHGSGQTLLREVLVLADHNSYHLGQLMLIRRTLERGSAPN
ncbi:MAG: DinB family protein [Pyrinomonadaceae bacterium]